MVLHTWTNISISNWQFLIPCYHQNSKGNVKHILFQHNLGYYFILLIENHPKNFRGLMINLDFVEFMPFMGSTRLYDLTNFFMFLWIEDLLSIYSLFLFLLYSFYLRYILSILPSIYYIPSIPFIVSLSYHVHIGERKKEIRERNKRQNMRKRYKREAERWEKEYLLCISLSLSSSKRDTR